MTDLIEQVARALASDDGHDPDEMRGRLDVDGKLPVWSAYKSQAAAAIAIIVERCALECDDFLMTKTSLDVLDIVRLKARIRTLAGGENNGGV